MMDDGNGFNWTWKRSSTREGKRAFGGKLKHVVHAEFNQQVAYPVLLCFPVNFRLQPTD
jgi:hypothetical protein